MDEFIIGSLPEMVHHPQSLYLCSSPEWMNTITVPLTHTAIKNYYCNMALSGLYSNLLAYRKSCPS